MLSLMVACYQRVSKSTCMAWVATTKDVPERPLCSLKFSFQNRSATKKFQGLNMSLFNFGR